MQQRLPLARAAHRIPGLAVFPDLLDVTPHRLPALDLARVFLRHAAAHVIAAVPLKPAARIIGVNPTFLPPFGQRLARVEAEIIERAVTAFRGKFRAREPTRGKLLATVGHVLAAEDAEPKHLFRRQVRLELRIEAAADRGNETVAVAALHLVADSYHARLHAAESTTAARAAIAFVPPRLASTTPIAVKTMPRIEMTSSLSPNRR